MENFSAISSYILVLSVITVLLMVLLLRQQRSPKDLPIWLFSSIAGMLLGAVVPVALVAALGYDVIPAAPPVEQAARSAQADLDSAVRPPGGGGPGAGGPGGGGPGGGMGGMGSMMGGGGGRGPSAKNRLTALVRKLELLTGDIEIELTAEQATQVNQLIADLDSADKMTDEEAQAKYDQLTAVLTDEQKAKEQAVGLPGGGGGRGGGGGMGGMGGMMGGMGGMMKKGGPPGGGQPDDSNPFKSDDNKKALQGLRARLSGSATESSEDADAAPAPSGEGPAQ